jgi:hypothetical protein
MCIIFILLFVAEPHILLFRRAVDYDPNAPVTSNNTQQQKQQVKCEQ